ncbi:hypothetical protein CCP3SC1AL1_280022 [Gammaproteobacteria bacterium]
MTDNAGHPLLNGLNRRGHSTSLSRSVALVTSNESLQNLVDLLGPKGRSWLLSTDLVVFSERTAAFAREFNLRGKVHVARQASDQGILETLVSLC